MSEYTALPKYLLGVRFALSWLWAACAIGATPATTSDFRVPKLFVDIAGTHDNQRRFMVHTSGFHSWFEPDAVTLEWSTSRLRIVFVGAKTSASIEGIAPASSRVHFLKGTQREYWQTDKPTFQAIAYRQLYQGIDLIWDGRAKYLKSELRLAPNADVGTIRIRYESAAAPRLTPGGDLLIATSGGNMVESAPEIYQVVAGRRLPIQGGFVLHADGTVGFAVGTYDRTIPLVIDPDITFSTLVGGSQFDAVTAVAGDAAGNSYFAGWTESLDMTTANALQPSNRGRVDGFVGKLGPGGALIFLTYFGGSGNDRATGIAVDASGSIYVVGSTDSVDFPIRNALQPARRAAGTDAFVARLSATGNSLIYSTYLGGAGADSASGIAVDAQANAYVVGQTASADFPLRGAMQSRIGGGTDGFVSKLDSAGNLVYSTYLGGSGNDTAAAVAVNSSGQAYVAGATASTDFPVTSGVVQRANGGGQDAFVAALNASGSALVFSTYFGGSGGTVGFPEAAFGIALDQTGDVWIAGVTSSPNLPLVAPIQGALAGGGTDGFVAELNPTGTALRYSSFLGGTGADIATGIALDGANNVYVAGYTTSVNFPVTLSAAQGANAGSYDAFLVQLSPSGSLVFGTYLGGSASDAAYGVAAADSGEVIVGGSTLSYNFPLVSALPMLNPDTYAGFITKFRVAAPTAPVAVSISPSSGTANAGTSQTFVVTMADALGAAYISWAEILISPQLNGFQACWIGYDTVNRQFYLVDDSVSSWMPGIAPTLANSQCSLNLASASVAASGTNLTLSLPVSFSPGFAGNKLLMAHVVNRAGLDSGWQILGTWHVLRPGNHAPARGTVTPFSGSGSLGSFTFTLSDPDGYSDLMWTEVIFNTGLNGRSGCYITYDPTYNVFQLANDQMTNWTQPTGAGTLENSQCLVFPLAATTAASGTTRSVTVPIAFKSGFLGAVSVYMHTIDASGVDTGWGAVGTWMVLANQPPASNLLSPYSGVGSTGRFTFGFSDPDGWSDLVWTEILFNSVLNGRQACYAMFDPARNLVYLVNDAYNGYAGVLRLGSPATIHNSQCSINGATASATISGTAVTLALSVTFTSAFSGTREAFSHALDSRGADSGWAEVGTWLVQ